MCGRFACSKIPAALAEAFGLVAPDDLPARRSIAPAMSVAALIRDDESTRPVFGWLHWGLVPFWARDKEIAGRTYNARSETAHAKPSFRAAFRHRRCLIPADGFFEWKRSSRTSGEKTPYYITRVDGPMVFAGLWETWEGERGEILLSCTILTTRANERLRPIRDRMPVILRPQDWDLWMDHRVQFRRDLDHLFEPYDADALQVGEVQAGPRDHRHEGTE